jgi:DNA (cytosine-5)-methyltransferase 1
MLTIGSLFSGIGGLELGLEWAGLGPTLWQVERDAFCRSVLATHWPDAKRYDDVERAGAYLVRPDILEPVDLICGGFPCQDVSAAGKCEGLSGGRSGLWFQFDRIVGEFLPPLVVVENVTSGAGRWVDAVRGCLAERGYETLPIPLSAKAVGAPHKRERVFIVGRRLDHPDGGRLEARAVTGSEEPQGREPQSSDGCVGHAVRKGSQGARGTEAKPAPRGERGNRLAYSNGESVRNERQRRPGRRSGELRAQGDQVARQPGRVGGRNPEPLVGRVPDGAALGLDPSTVAASRPLQWPARRGEPQRGWEPRRSVPANAIEHRGPRLHALGNAVVPHDAEVVGWVIRELMGTA